MNMNLLGIKVGSGEKKINGGEGGEKRKAEIFIQKN